MASEHQVDDGSGRCRDGKLEPVDVQPGPVGVVQRNAVDVDVGQVGGPAALRADGDCRKRRDDAPESVKRGGRVVGEHRFALASALPRKAAAFEMQPGGDLAFVATVGVAHAQDPATDAMHVTGAGESSDVVA